MRLLSLQQDGQLSLTDDIIDSIPPYAILSHTWGRDEEEVSFEDLTVNVETKKNGYGFRKINFCGAQAAAHGLQHFWVDTCCINKASSSELQEAITSMFRWYQNSAHCYVYLPDVQLDDQDPRGWQTAFRKSRWFTRGWTLQELLAPSSVEFFDKDGKRLGDKVSLQDLLHEITGIPIEALRGRRPLSAFSVNERMLWARGRDTKRQEDKSYSLMGIFGVSMFLNYGEGEDHAMRRLRREIEHPSSKDTTLRHVLPFGRNRAFVGRGEVLTGLLRLIPPKVEAQDCQRIAVEGLGGIGKTQIALEAAFRLQEMDPACSIFWVPAVSRATFENAYRTIGQALKIPEIDHDNADVKASVASALSNSPTRWCLIIDNLDDTELLSAADDNCPISDYLPFSTNGSILITTRNHEIATQLDIHPNQIFTIEEMSKTEATNMLREVVKPKQMQDKHGTDDLLGVLAYLPLAIKQAAAYMSRTGISTKKYLERYRLSDASRIALLSRPFADQGRYRAIANPIATTWLISFSHIERNYPLAALSLKHICFLAEKDIPRELFPADEDETKLDEAIGILQGYGFLLEREDGDSFDIHPLVRLVTRNSIKDEDDQYIATVMEQLSWYYPWPEPGNRDVWMRYLPHAETVLSSPGGARTVERSRADIFNKVGISYHILGKYRTAERMYQHASAIRERELGERHPDTLSTRRNIGSVLSHLGEYKKAELVHRQLLGIHQDELGSTHSSTLNSMNDLAATLRCLGRYEEAEQMSRQALQRLQHKLGPEHYDTLRSMNDLAVTLQYLGRLKEAEQLHRHLLQKHREEYGSRHPDTLISMSNLGSTLSDMGKFGEAHDLFRQTLQINREDFGAKHPYTLTSMNNLAVVLKNLGEDVEVERIYREALQLSTQELGLDHPTTLTSLHNLALLLRKLEKNEEAEKLLRQTGGWRNFEDIPVWDRLDKVYDPDCSDVLLVDVGGGIGHDPQELKRKHFDIPGNLTLQDKIKSPPQCPISQPVRHARAYHLHSVLHDWSDNDCVKILEQLKPAMKPGYSSLDQRPYRAGPQRFVADHADGSLDGGVRRHEGTDAGRLGEHPDARAGLKVVQVYSYEMGSESLIEAELA